MTGHGNNGFDRFVREIEAKASPAERRDLEAARIRFAVGARVLQLRRSAGLTQQQLAASSGIAQADVSRIERGQANPTVNTLQALAGSLGATLALVTGEPRAAA